jgi:glycosyltransferase involved in cell wall biosynthesis
VRLLFLTPLYVPWVGGLENFVRQLIAELRQRDHEIMVVTSHAGLTWERDEVDGVEVLRVPAHRSVGRRDAAELLRIQAELVRILTSFEPDVVHSHDAGPVLWLYNRAARRRPRPVVVTLHIVMTHHFDGALDVLGKLLREADWVTGVSQAVAEDTLTYEPSVADRISVIRNAIAPSTTPATAVPVDPPRLLCIGRLVPQKGFDIALDALALLAADHPSVTLSVAGEGPEAASLRAQAVALGVADRVEFLGSVDRVALDELVARSTAVLMPSRFEGLPLVAIETAWAGRPVVATKAPGMQDAVIDGVTGLLVDGDDATALADGVARLLSDPAAIQALGIGARAVAERDYSMPACVSAYEDVYRAVAAARTG